MSEEVINRFYDELMERPGPQNIQFGETEPLLSYDLIQQTFLQRQEIRKFFHGMTTNGVLLTRDRLDFLQEQSVCIKVSIDGGPISYQKEKGDHLEEVLNNISYARQPKRISLTYVITEDKLPRLQEDLKFLWEEVRRYGELNLLINILDGWNPKAYDEMLRIVKTFLRYNYHPTKTLFTQGMSALLPQLMFLEVDALGKIYLSPPARTSKMPSDPFFLDLIEGGLGTIFEPREDKLIKAIQKYGKNYGATKFVCLDRNCDDCISKDYCKPPQSTAEFRLDSKECLTYIFNKEVTENLNSPDFDYGQLIAETPLHSVCLGVTDRCNMCCRYCFATDRPRDMDLGTAKASIMWILDQQKQGGTTHVNFFGGEPLIRFDEVIKPLVEWSEEMGFSTISYGMTTNGSLMTPERLHWCATHNVAMLLSIDGGPETQNANRPLRSGKDSFQVLADIIPTFLHYYPDVTFRSTVYPPTAHLLYENYLWAEALGFNHYYCTPDEFSEWSPEQIDSYAEGLQNVYWHMYRKITNGERVLHIQELFDELKDIVSPPEDKGFTLDHLKRCGLGTSSIGIGVDGRLVGCQEHTTSEESIFDIGNIFTGIDRKRHINLLQEYARDCVGKEASCPSHSFGVSGSVTELSPVRVMYQKLMRKIVTEILNHAQENNNQVFLDYAKESFKKRGMM